MSYREFTRVGGIVLLILSVALAGCGSVDSPTTASRTHQPTTPSATVSSTTPQTQTDTPAKPTTVSSGDERPAISYTAASVEFESSTRYGIFRESTIEERIKRTGHATVLTRSAHRSRIAFGRLERANDLENVIEFINQTDFEHEALFVLSRRFGGAGGEYTITTMWKRNVTTWQVRTLRRSGPAQAESTGVIIIRFNQTTNPLPDHLRIIHKQGDKNLSSRTVSLP